MDAAGNITSNGAFNYTFNQTGQLAQVFKGLTPVSNYYYNYLGQRTRKVVGSVTTLYHYDQAGHLITETDNLGNILRTYIWRDDTPYAQIESSSGHDVVYYIEVDSLNTPRTARDASGNIIWQWYSDAFGSIQPNQDPDGNGINTVINLRFAGQYYDVESGLVYNVNRYYAPSIGRYLQSDPIGLAGGVGTYTYVSNNPLTRIDPFGLSDLVYDNNARTLTITDGNGNVVGVYPAANNAQSTSRGPWPEGTYTYAYPTTHSDDAPNSRFGSNGNFVFNLPGCQGCGVHSGRANSTDLAGRSGTEYATNGCIRTTEQATQKINNLIQSGDPLRTLTVDR